MNVISISRFCCTSILLLLAANLHARPCNSVESEDERLRCFDQLSRCARIENGTDRLACYDAAYQLDIAVIAEDVSTTEPTVAEPVVEPVLEAATVVAPTEAAAPPAAEKTADELFPVRGASRQPAASAPAAEEVASMTAVIIEVSKDQRKLATMRLDNGQVWREIKKSRFIYKPGMTVIISAGVFGSTNLTAPGMSKYVKVKRLK